MSGWAVISECGTYRYRLGRRWAWGPKLLFIMLNPSTADGEVDDATMRRCIAFAQAHGYGCLEVVNLFAFRAKKPADLRAAGFPVGPENDHHIGRAICGVHRGAPKGLKLKDIARVTERRPDVCVAWGANATGLSRPAEVLALLASLGIVPKCLSVTRGGQPAHPLRLSKDCRLQAFTPPTTKTGGQA